jgi:bacillithiol synthase
VPVPGLPPLPTAFLAGRDRDLLDPLVFLDPDDGFGALVERPPTAVARAPLARALAAANRAYGHPLADELARRLADPETRVVVTGQQPGLWGGPLYTLSKMVAARLWADRLEEAGVPAVPVFWVATEDHDWDEVARARVPGRSEVHDFRLGDDPSPMRPVGMRTLGSGLPRAYEELAEATHGDRYEDWLDVLQRWYRPDARFGEAFSRLMVHLLGERTPLLLDSMLPELKTAQQPVLRRLVTERDAVEAAYAAADAEIETRGYSHQVTPQRGASPLFVLDGRDGDCRRRRVEWVGDDRYRLRGSEGEARPVEDLLDRLDENPSTVSPGVLARPAVQDAVLGSHLQILGPGEMSYMPQAAATYRALGLAAPFTALRPQVLVIEPHLEDKIEQVGLGLEALLEDDDAVEARLADRAGGDPVAPVRQAVEGLLDDLKASLLDTDAQLERPWEKTRDQILRGLDTLAGKTTAARARRDEVTAGRVGQLRQAFRPGGAPQERVVVSSHFPAKYRARFTDALFGQMGLDPRFLQVVRLSDEPPVEAS